MQNGFPRSTDNMTVSGIKEKAKEHVQKEARGASASSLIKAARHQSLVARECELKGDLKSALSAVIMAASLAQMCMQSAELAEKRGVLYKEFAEYMEVRYSRHILDVSLEVTSNSVATSQPRLMCWNLNCLKLRRQVMRGYSSNFNHASLSCIYVARMVQVQMTVQLIRLEVL
jgi:hypothetical protein